MVADNRSDAIFISIADQMLALRIRNKTVFTCPVSSASKGVGEVNGSERTPRGWHYVRAKIGAGQPSGSVFVGRRPTGEIYAQGMRQDYPHRDWILTRILWLCGLEPGFNRLGKVDTMRRYIYIHGCPDEDDFTRPGSHGCIKLHNPDMLELFERVQMGTTILISE